MRRHASLIDRHYDPQTGQFISVDPLVDETGQPYAYVGDNPVDNVDPEGLCGSIWGCITTAFDTARHEVASGYDAASNGVNSGWKWANNRVNAAICLDFGGRGGLLGGWLDSQAGCSSDEETALSSNSEGSTCPSIVTGGSLQFLHSIESLRDSAGYQYWSQQPTEEILRSLAPDTGEGLLVNTNGTILDGNTRALVLKDRGFDIDSLPREIRIPSEGFPDVPDLPFEG